MPQEKILKQTPLFGIHKKLGGKMVSFAGWQMPIQYPSGVVQEHLSVRNHAGLFDVSHMGEIEIRGSDAWAFAQSLITNDISRMTDGSILYTLMCMDHGGVLDDLLIYRFLEDHYFFCVNASNSKKDFQWILKRAKSFNVQVRDISSKTAQLAIQGPKSKVILECLGKFNDLKYFCFKVGNIDSIECIISRTGYTGEDGFEIYFDSVHATTLYKKITDAGKDSQLKPVGLAARDTLRMEMGYALYGQEIDETTSPLEAGLSWVVKLDNEDFVGKTALLKQKSDGLSRKLVGIKMLNRGVPRSHYPIFKDDRKIGELTSGTHSPSLKTGIGLGYVENEFCETGTKVELEIRNQRYEGELVQLPFVPSRVRK